jgi:glycyl-tRNA synthetase
MSNQETSLETIVSLCKRRGFIYPGSDVYGGLSGTWDYGPLGVQLKRNIMQLWWKMFVDDAENMYGVDAAILMNQKVWQASGHVDTFTDPLVECKECKSRFRADKIDTAKCPTCGKENTFGEPRQFNMMFKTHIGPVDEIPVSSDPIVNARIDLEKKTAKSTQVGLSETVQYSLNNDTSLVYLRPETAQGIFTNYRNVVDSFYPDLPFGLAQQGKAFRNEISPRDFIFRSREFEQMEIEYFVAPDKWEVAFEEWRKNVWKWTQALGLPDDKVHELEVPENDRAHYSKRTIDFEFDFPIGREELLGLAYRTDFDLQNIQRVSGKGMEYRPKDGSAPFVPHVIEPSFGLERTIMAVLTSAYTEDEVNGEKRSYLKLPNHLAPVKVAVSPLLKNKPELVAKAREVYRMLKNPPADMPELRSLEGKVVWDDNGNIGKRYRRQDEIGTPYCVVIDFDTLEGDTANTVTVRNRDTTEQKRISILALAEYVGAREGQPRSENL